MIVECPECGGQNSYFNGYCYECPECDCEWGEDGILEHGDEFNDEYEDFKYLDKKEKFIEKQDEIRIGNKINENSFRNLFSPSWQLEKNLALYSEEGVEEKFSDEVLYKLIETKDYNSINNLVKPKQLSEIRINEIIERMIFIYLDSRDELPFYPNSRHWANYVKAPIKLIDKIMNDTFMHHTSGFEYVNFSELFNNKLKNWYNRKRRDDEVSEELNSFEELKNIFHMIVNGEQFDSYHSPFIENLLRNDFSIEINLVKKLKSDIKKWGNGPINELLVKAKKDNLSKIDTIVLILKNYFKNIME